jgi:hypothetical protein
MFLREHCAVASVSCRIQFLKWGRRRCGRALGRMFAAGRVLVGDRMSQGSEIAGRSGKPIAAQEKQRSQSLENSHDRYGHSSETTEVSLDGMWESSQYYSPRNTH